MFQPDNTNRPYLNSLNRQLKEIDAPLELIIWYDDTDIPDYDDAFDESEDTLFQRNLPIRPITSIMVWADANAGQYEANFVLNYSEAIADKTLIKSTESYDFFEEVDVHTQLPAYYFLELKTPLRCQL